MKKHEDVGSTLEALGFKIVDNEKYVKDEVTILATDTIGHTVDSFMEKARRKGWIEETTATPWKSMLLEPGTLLNNMIFSNVIGGIQIGYPQASLIITNTIRAGCVPGVDSQCGCIEAAKRAYGSILPVDIYPSGSD